MTFSRCAVCYLWALNSILSDPWLPPWVPTQVGTPRASRASDDRVNGMMNFIFRYRNVCMSGWWSLNVYLSYSVWDKYNFFWHEWTSEYICYPRYWTNEYPNIFGMIKISRMNIKINLPMKKSTNIFANEYICQKYFNVFEYQIIFPRLFWTILAIFICCVILYPYWTIFDQ